MRNLKRKLGLAFAILLFTAPVTSAVEYEWTDVSGAVQSLADYKGKPVMLHFWASWCPPCREEMPELEAWSKENRDVKLVVITLDRNIDDAIAFLKSKNISFSALRGDMDPAQRLGVRGLPTTVVIGSDSSIIKTRTGAVNWGGEEGASFLKTVDGES